MTPHDISFLQLKDAYTFEQKALEVFHYQYKNNEIYQKFCIGIKRNPKNVKRILDIPFLPISFFKSHSIFSDKELPSFYFESSGTTSMVQSKHYIKDIDVYNQVIDACFDTFFGPYEDFVVFGLLPHYLERKHSSLVYMVNRWVQHSIPIEKHFYLDDLQELKNQINIAISQRKKIILIGITFALLDFIEIFETDYDKIIILETGGMKGRREEIPKKELWNMLKRSFKNGIIGSEYGMCELLSQSFAFNQPVFNSPSWKKILVADINDPLSISFSGQGVASIIDLANYNSCSFIQTEDLAKVYENGSFEILGRKDHSEWRGCSLLLDQN